MQPSLTQGDDARSAAPRPRSRVRAPAIKPPEVAQWRLDDALVEVAPSDRARNAWNAHGPQCAGFDNTFLFFSAPATDATAEGMLQLLLAGEWTAPRNPKTPGTSGTAGKCGRATPSGSGTWRRSARARRTRGSTRGYHWRFQRASTTPATSSDARCGYSRGLARAQDDPGYLLGCSMWLFQRADTSTGDWGLILLRWGLILLSVSQRGR